MIILFTVLFQSVLQPASQQADRISRLFNFFNIAAAGMLLLVITLVVYICIKFKKREGDETEPAPADKNGRLELLMIGIPTLLLAWFFYQTVTTMHAVAPSAVATHRQPDVIITGHQWWWEVEYPAAKVTTANEVHLPVGKPLLLEMRAADVIHDWWVPELGNKMDLVPNVNNYLSLHINRSGEYIGVCSEFCGAQHAWMRIHVIAQNEKDYNQWLSANAVNALPPQDTLAITGAALFQTKTCGSCHRIQGTNAAGNAGPDLTHLESRQTLLTGLLKNNEADLFQWINHPQEVKPGAHMPNFIFSKDTVNAIVHYLIQLK